MPKLLLLLVVGVIIAAGYVWLRPGDEIDRVARAASHQREDMVRDLVRAWPAERRTELLLRVAALENGEDLAHAVLTETIETDPAHADLVLVAFRQRYPDHPMSSTWAVALRIKQGHLDDAIAVYRAEAAKLGDRKDDRSYLLYQLATRLTAAGRPLEAFAEAGPDDREYAFRVVCGMLETGCDKGEATAVAHLRAIVAEHERRGGPTPWTAFFAGLADEGDKKLEEAQAHYAEAMRRLQADGYVPVHTQFQGTAQREWEKVRHRRTMCLWRLGRWEQAYDECLPPEDTFRALSQTFEPRERADDLQRLVQRHRERVPHDPTLPYWQALMHYQRGEYALAVPLCEEHLRVAKIPHLFEQQAHNLKFRSLIRLERIAEARAMLHAPNKRRWPMELHWEMIVAAKTGDVVTVDKILADYVAVGRDYPAAAYADEDLGPLLRGAALVDLRRKYPPPPLP